MINCKGCGFLRRGTGKRTSNKSQPIHDRIEPRPHWWEMRALTTAPPTLPKYSLSFSVNSVKAA